MPLPKDIRFVSFDCYGTLIDWESGAFDAFQKEADRDGFTVDRDTLIPFFLDIQHDVMSGSYELYAEVMRRTAIRWPALARAIAARSASTPAAATTTM